MFKSAIQTLYTLHNPLDLEQGVPSNEVFHSIGAALHSFNKDNNYEDMDIDGPQGVARLDWFTEKHLRHMNNLLIRVYINELLPVSMIWSKKLHGVYRFSPTGGAYMEITDHIRQEQSINRDFKFSQS